MLFVLGCIIGWVAAWLAMGFLIALVETRHADAAQDAALCDSMQTPDDATIHDGDVGSGSFLVAAHDKQMERAGADVLAGMDREIRSWWDD